MTRAGPHVCPIGTFAVVTSLVPLTNECDVKLSADGVPFLLHDATLERDGTVGVL